MNSGINKHSRMFGRRIRQWLLMIASTTALVACSSGPPPKLYLLEPANIAESQASQTGSLANIRSLGMSSVTLPDYAGSPQIATLQVDGTVSQDDHHRWAEEPEDAISRVLANRLRALTVGSVLIEPWPRDYKPKARVEVIIDRLLRSSTGGVEISGQLLLLSGDGRRLQRALPFNMSLVGNDTQPKAFFAALYRAIDDIAKMAVKELQKLRI